MEFTTIDLEGALRRAFVDRRWSSICVDGHDLRSEYLRQSISLGITEDLLKLDSTNESEQWTTMTYKLTEKGKQYFGLSK